MKHWSNVGRVLCVSNLLGTIVKHYDSDVTEYEFDFLDLQDGNARFEAFKNDVNSREAGVRLATCPAIWVRQAETDHELERPYDPVTRRIRWASPVKSPQESLSLSLKG
jgi:hypothetical protein